MGEITTVPFTHHTWNPWRGCAHALLKDGTPHPGCRRCYAERMATRNPLVLGIWGDEGTRPSGTEAYWKLPYKWAQAAQIDDERRRVFMSLADPFEDRDELRPHRTRQFQTIDETADWLDYLLFTKRPQNAPKLWPGGMARSRRNVWIIYSASDQHSLESWLPELFACRPLVPVLGVSAEPLLGTIDLSRRLPIAPRGDRWERIKCEAAYGESRPRLDWVIVGGESGPGFEDLNLAHLESVVAQCQAAGVPVWVKQDSGPYPDRQGRIPNDLWQIKQLPKVAA